MLLTRKSSSRMMGAATTLFSLAGIGIRYVVAEDGLTWAFSGQDDRNGGIRQCQSLQITINNDGNNAHPPYTLYAYPIEGIPTSSMLGSGSSLSWTPPYRSGTQLVLGVYDAAGTNAGWVPIYTVASSSDTSCLNDAPSHSSVQVSLNTTSASVCSTVGISVGGGRPPYTINVLPAGTISSTLNETFPNYSDMYYNWVANVDSGNHMMVGIRDSQGTFAASPPLVTVTSGGNSDSCPGRSSATTAAPSGSAGTVSIGATGTAAAGAGSGDGGGGGSSNAGAIAGGVVGGVVGLALILVGAWFLYRRYKRSQAAAVPHSRVTEKQASKQAAAGTDGDASAGAAAERVAANPPQLPLPEDIEKQQPTNARITPFTDGIPEDEQATNEHGPNDIESGAAVAAGTKAGKSTKRGSGRLGTSDSQLMVANPDPEEGGNIDRQPSTSRRPPQDQREASATEEAGGLPSGGESKSPRPPSPPHPRVMQHVDAGPQEQEEETTSQVEELPPAYASLRR